MAASPRRLSRGGLIDRSAPLRFSFDGRALQGFAGDTLASALLGAGVDLTGRSFKYHRPRGIMGAGSEEPASLVQLVGDEDAPNMPVTCVPLREGLAATSINCWPSVGLDVGAIAQGFARLLPAGFYYKTFMWPDWRLFEPAIRRAAGLGRAPARDPAHLRYETRFDTCDVLIVGAGPAGLMAARAAGRCGARVLLVDDDAMPGGRLLNETATIGGAPALDWVGDCVRELDAMESVVRLPRSVAWAFHDHGFVMVTERAPARDGLFQRTRRVRARQVVIATGAIERPLVFANNDRPGVMLASAVRTYINRYAVRPGRAALVFTNNDSAYATAFDLARAGAERVTILDSRSGAGHALSEAARRAGIEVLRGHVVRDARGGRHLGGVEVVARAGGSARRIDCDLLCVSGGWNPAVHLFSQSRGRLRYHDGLASFVPDEPAQAAVCCGSAAGVFDLAGCLSDGLRAGLEAAAACGLAGAGLAAPPLVAPPAEGNDGTGVEPLWIVEHPERSRKAFVDIQNDVTAADVRLAVREGFAAVEHVKRYTTAGMGVDQGKTGNVNVIGLLAADSGRGLGEVGTTTFRPAYVPIEFGAIAGLRPGPLVLPFRHTPMTAWHKARGAAMYEAGARWRRPGYYPDPGETFQRSVDRESRAVRQAVGLYDASPLGKFEIKGPDALRLLDFVYTNAWADLPVGCGRYGIMLTEDGLIFDDGVTFRLGEDRYLMTSSTANADPVYRRLQEILQVERPEWRVKVTDVTAQWANATLCGPLAREVLSAAGTDIELAREAFPFMTAREGRVAGLPARVCRVSFTGELSFEVNVAARDGLALWERLMAAGAPHGIAPVGSEANHVLRVEKGFLSLGHEVDGTADPHDLGMAWIVSRKKPDFSGKRALAIRRATGAPRRELIGLLPEDPAEMIVEGSPITPGGRREKAEGFVSACVWSVVLERTVALGLLRDGRSRMGEWVSVRLADRVVRAQVTKPVFHDPDGLRLRG